MIQNGYFFSIIADSLQDAKKKGSRVIKNWRDKNSDFQAILRRTILKTKTTNFTVHKSYRPCLIQDRTVTLQLLDERVVLLSGIVIAKKCLFNFLVKWHWGC
jgi:hypothetical protein